MVPFGRHFVYPTAPLSFGRRDLEMICTLNCLHSPHGTLADVHNIP